MYFILVFVVRGTVYQNLLVVFFFFLFDEFADLADTSNCAVSVETG